MISAIIDEILLKKSDWQEFTFESIYFGGGTPSILEEDEYKKIIETLKNSFSFSTHVELTLEANPDDINPMAVKKWNAAGINRLSIGLQSLNNEELAFMNRSHTAAESLIAVDTSLQSGIADISVDLIYGSHLKTDKQWEFELNWALNSGANHLSAYALTVESKTALAHRIKKGLIPETNDEHQSNQFMKLTEIAASNQWDFYEISNLCKPEHRAIHNSNYWKNKPYLGIGPSAHSYKDKTRFWNASNNAAYIKKVNLGELPQTSEVLSDLDLANETILTQLRLSSGLRIDAILSYYSKWLDESMPALEKMKQNQWIKIENNTIKLLSKGRLMADNISAELFIS